ncbi:AIM24 family protein [Alloiococcus sp. CFN-8]|uniref:AIM24 family protein n=1 Tax=Alloiococcus sp. CFN-8 TaxID=3416081 RepID=UPI003CEC0DBE
MRTNLKITNNLEILSEMTGDSTFQILEYETLSGSLDIASAEQMYFMREIGMTLKQVKIILEDSSVRLQSGALSYMKGRIDLRAGLGVIIGLGKKLMSSRATGESAIKPLYTGTGEIYLEPSFGHYALIELEDDEVIIDDGLFYACEEGIEVGAAMQKNISSAFFGNEGLFQTKLEGSGVAALELPVPEHEIRKVVLINDTLKVDGNFALLRTGDIEFTVEKSSKSLIGSAASGEGLVNVYRGTGEIWLMPTKEVYNKIALGNYRNLTENEGRYDTEV